MSHCPAAAASLRPLWCEGTAPRGAEQDRVSGGEGKAPGPLLRGSLSRRPGGVQGIPLRNTGLRPGSGRALSRTRMSPSQALLPGSQPSLSGLSLLTCGLGKYPLKWTVRQGARNDTGRDTGRRTLTGHATGRIALCCPMEKISFSPKEQSRVGLTLENIRSPALTLQGGKLRQGRWPWAQLWFLLSAKPCPIALPPSSLLMPGQKNFSILNSHTF